MKVLDAPDLGYEHNWLAEMEDRLKRDGYPIVADAYRARALKAQEIYDHVSSLGQFTNSMSPGTFVARGENLVNELLSKGWTPPKCIPTKDVGEAW